MPFNGNGTFVTIGDPAVPDEVIRADQFNNAIDDIATGLTDAMTRDGQSPPTANIPMGGMKLTGLANATAAQDAVTKAQMEALFATAVTAVAPARNSVYNPAFCITQKGSTSETSIGSSPAWLAGDRWFVYNEGTNQYYVSFPGVVGASIPFYGSCKVRRFAGTTTPLWLTQVLPAKDLYDLANKTVTLSFYARKGAGFSEASSRLTVKVFTGTGADQGVASFIAGTWTGAVNDSTTVSLTSSFARYTFTTTLGNIGELALSFGYQPVGAIPGAEDWYEISGVKLEVGSTATAWEQPDFQLELLRCMRFYEKSFDYSYAPGYAAGVVHGTYGNQMSAASTNGKQFAIRYAVPKYNAVGCVITTYNPVTGASAQVRNISRSTDCTLTSVNLGRTGFQIGATPAAGSALGDELSVCWTCDGELA